MNNKEIALHTNKILKTKAFLDYNVIEVGSNEIIQDSRLKTFIISYKTDDGCGVIIEYINGKIFLSFFYNPTLIDKIDCSEIVRKLPIRFQEIIAKIKQLNNNPISKSFLKEITELAVNRVPKRRIGIIDYADSRYSILLFMIENLLVDKICHTYLYINKPLFGKINILFRASRKKTIKSIDEIIDAGK